MKIQGTNQQESHGSLASSYHGYMNFYRSQLPTACHSFPYLVFVHPPLMNRAELLAAYTFHLLLRKRKVSLKFHFDLVCTLIHHCESVARSMTRIATEKLG